jgi:hypothetical protein
MEKITFGKKYFSTTFKILLTTLSLSPKQERKKTKMGQKLFKQKLWEDLV